MSPQSPSIPSQPWQLANALPIFCFLGALPPLYRGIWINTSGVAWLLCMTVVALICSFVLTQLLKDSANLSCPQPLSVPQSPLLISLGALVFLSLCNLPATVAPLTSWMGSPDMMMGGWIWLALFCLLCLYKPNQVRSIRDLAVVTVLAITFLSFFFHPKLMPTARGDWVIYSFLAYLAWVGTSALVLSIDRPKQDRWFLVALGVALIIASQSRLGLIGLTVGTASWAVIHFMMPQRLHGRFLLGSLISLPVAYILSLAVCVHYQILPSMISRYVSLKVVWTGLMNQPWHHWIIGNGWGQMVTLLEQQKRSLLQLQVPNVHGNLSLWEGLTVKDGSSLNQVLDATYAVGLGGGVAMFVLAMAPYLLYMMSDQKQKSPYAEGIAYITTVISVLMTHGWFMMLSVLPLWVVALHTTWPVGRPRSVPMWGLLGGCTLGALALLWTAQQIPR